MTTTTQLNPRTGLTCLTCRLLFENGEIQREHYASEWHHYNIKRKVASLPPVSQHDFMDKLQHITQTSGNVVRNADLFCSCCHKKFQTDKAYENHLDSKKHKENVMKGGAAKNSQDTNNTRPITEEEKCENQTEDSTVNDDELLDIRKAIPTHNCLFCPSSCKNMDFTIEHMSLSHGFNVPDFQYCSDLPGLIKYLGLKIGAGRTCIHCNSSRFRDLDALQKHMRDKNHCTFRIDEGEEGLLEFVDFYDYSDMYEGEESPENITLYDEGFFMTLPSGARIGHRSLMRYFKQSLKPANNEYSAPSTRSQLGSKMKQLGWTGLSGPLSVRHAKDVAFIKRAVQNYRLKLGMSHNKIFVTKGRKDQM